MISTIPNIMLQKASSSSSTTAPSAAASVIWDLIPFDVQIALETSNHSLSTVNNKTLLDDLVTEWMTSGWNQTARSNNKTSELLTLESLYLERTARRQMSDMEDGENRMRQHHLQSIQQVILTVTYQGSTVWQLRSASKVNFTQDLVTTMEETVLSDPRQTLLSKLQSASDSTGFGSAVSSVQSILLLSTGDPSRSAAVASSLATQLPTQAIVSSNGTTVPSSIAVGQSASLAPVAAPALTAAPSLSPAGPQLATSVPTASAGSPAPTAGTKLPSSSTLHPSSSTTSLPTPNQTHAVTPSPTVLTPPPTTTPTALATTASPIAATNAPTVTTASPTSQPISTAAPTVATPFPSASPSRVPTTPRPTLLPTSRPTLSTKLPTRHPTVRPTVRPSVRVTSRPTFLTLAPTASPSVATGTPTAATLSPTSFPTGIPTTLTPSKSPSRQPTHKPSKKPTKFPTKLPTIQPTHVPSHKPTHKPTHVGSTNRPTLPSHSPSLFPSGAPSLLQDTLYKGLNMTLYGIRSFGGSAESDWTSVTQTYITDYFKNHSHYNVTVHGVILTYQSSTLSFSRRQRSLMTTTTFSRGLQQGRPSMVITYNQEFQYNQDSGIQPADIVQLPFTGDTSFYVELLKNKNPSAFFALSGVSEVALPGPSISPVVNGNHSTGGLSKTAKIAIGAGCGVLVLAMLVALFDYLSGQRGRRYKQRINSKDEEDAIAPFSHVQLGATGDEISTLEEPQSPANALRLASAAESIAGYRDQSVATVDYEYTKAYGGLGNKTVSSAGGTFGSNTQENVEVTDAAVAAGAAQERSFSDSDEDTESFDTHYRPTPSPKEILIDVFAPPGKLGVVIDTPDEGAPVIHAVKDTSAIADQLQVGDKLVAVDDEDVRAMSAIKVSKLISRSSENPSRKLTVLRTVVE